MNIAHISPNKKAFSETFIEAHKQFLKGNIFYYYGGELPDKLENGIVINSRKTRMLDIIKGYYRLNKFSLPEQALIASFRKNRVNIVFAEYGGTGERMVPVCEELDIPLIVHFHGHDAARCDELERNNYYERTFQYADFVICVSKVMKQKLLQLGCPAEKLIYNVYGPRQEFFEVEPKFSKSQFVFAGRFVNKKAPHYLILAFLKVVEIFPEATLVMAGDGVLKESCQNLVKFYNLENNVFFPGVVDAETLMNYFSEALAFVQHSVTAENGDSEGTPVVILEAGAAGIPVISTKHAGIPDVIIDGETGFLVDEKDVDAMTQKMLLLLENRDMAKTTGLSARERIGSSFSLDKHIRVLDSLVQEGLRR